MRAFTFFARFVATLLLSVVLLTVLLWNAPGRDLDIESWGQTGAAGPVVTSSLGKTYIDFAKGYGEELLSGRGGISTAYNAPASELIAERAPVTITQATYGFTLAWIGSLLTGVLSHFRRQLGDVALHAGSVLLAVPSAVLVLTFLLAGAPPWVGLAGCVWPKTYAYWESTLRSARRRNHVLGLLAQGAGPWRVQWYGIWRPSLRQLFGLLAVSVPLLLGALIPVEVLCDAPGLGQLAWKAVSSRDLPLLTTLTMLFTAVTCGMSLLAESLTPETA